MKQIALAMHNYHDSYGHFPPRAICSKDGKPLLSWRVTLLPYLEGNHVYERFHLDEPWDSPHNIELLKEMPSIYRQPYSSSAADKQETIYQVPVGPGTIFGGSKIPSISEISDVDGLSNTLLLVEAGEPVPWSRPADLEIGPDKPVPPLGGLFRKAGWRPFARDLTNPNVFNAAFADGHVQTLSKVWMKANINAVSTWNGGELVQLP